jgi:hypothetical protein
MFKPFRIHIFYYLLFNIILNLNGQSAQHKDILLNPTLWYTCKLDSTKYCQDEINGLENEKLNGLDPMLTKACLNEINEMCSQDIDDKKEDCLRLKFQQKKISINSKCHGVYN